MQLARLRVQGYCFDCAALFVAKAGEGGIAFLARRYVPLTVVPLSLAHGSAHGSAHVHTWTSAVVNRKAFVTTG